MTINCCTVSQLLGKPHVVCQLMVQLWCMVDFMLLRVIWYDKHAASCKMSVPDLHICSAKFGLLYQPAAGEQGQG